MQRNFRLLYADSFWFGVLSGSTIAFITIYMARLGGSALEIGLLTAGPAVVNLLFSLPVGLWLAGRPLVLVSFWSALLSRLAYLALIPLPLLFEGAGQLRLIILLTLLMSVPGTILAIGFNAMFAEVVPARFRAEVVGRRNAILAVSLTISTLVCGQLLDRIIFPLNYQVVFGMGASGALLSTVNIGRLRASSGPAEKQRASYGTRLKDLLRFNLLGSHFGLFLIAYLSFYAFQYFCIPIFPLAYVNELHLSDGLISLGGGLFFSAMFLVSLRLKSLSVRIGHHYLLAFSAVGLAFYPFLLGLARGPLLYWVASGLGGLTYGLVSASLLNRLMERVPEQARAAGMSYHNLVLSLGILIGSLAGAWAGEFMEVQPALLLGAGLRLLAGLLLIFWG
jgi:hypothetical protein